MTLKDNKQGRCWFTRGIELVLSGWMMNRRVSDVSSNLVLINYEASYSFWSYQARYQRRLVCVFGIIADEFVYGAFYCFYASFPFLPTVLISYYASLLFKQKMTLNRVVNVCRKITGIEKLICFV